MTTLPPTNALRFKTQVFLVWFFRFATALCLCGVVAFAWLQLTHQSPSLVLTLVAFVIFGVFGAYCWRAQGRAQNQYAVDETGIWRLPPKGAPLFIPWNDVNVVRADDVAQRLIVSDRTGARTLWLEYQLDGFPALRDYILQRTSRRARENQTAGSVFHEWIVRKIVCILLIFPAFYMGFFEVFARIWLGAAMCLSFGGLLFYAVVQEPLSLTIGKDRILIRYPGWKRQIAFSEIASVTLSNTIAGNGNTLALVTIALKGRKPIILKRFREGSLALNQALQDAVGSASAPRPNEVNPAS